MKKNTNNCGSNNCNSQNNAQGGINSRSNVNSQNNQNNGYGNQNYNNRQNNSYNQNNGNSDDDIQANLNHYGNMSEEHLMNELMKAAKTEKQNGTLTPQMLDMFYNTIMPSMNAEQSKKMSNLINQLKK